VTAAGDVVPLPPEYKVSRHLTEVGNVPGNLIDLANLADASPRVLVKTVVTAPTELLEGQLAQVEEMLLEVISPLEGVVATSASSQGNLSVVLVEFEAGGDLSQVTLRVDEAIDPLRPEAVSQDSEGEGEEDSDWECSEEEQRFASTTEITEEWGDCETVYQGGIRADCYRTVCRNTRTGEVTQTPGKQAEQGSGKALLAQQQGDELPPGSLTVVLPVALGPDHVAQGENVAQRALGWGGRITAPAIKDITAANLRESLLELIEPGGEIDAFSRKGVYGALGTFIVLDLGSPIGVNRIRFYPRNTVHHAPQYPFQNDFLRQFELLLHAGQDLVLDGTGQLVPKLEDYEVLFRTTDNQESVVDVEVSPARAVRFVRIKSTSSFPYEIDEIDVFGQGFIGSSRYISHVYDLEGAATWGNIRWLERLVDLRRGDQAAGEAEDDGNCTEETKEYATADEIPSDWGDCETITYYIEGQGYTNVWQCYRTTCRDEQTGEMTTTPGRNRGKTVAAKPVAVAPSEIVVRTRTGRDPTPFLYRRRNVQRIGEAEESASLEHPGEQLGRDEYLALSPDLEATPPFVWDKGEVTEDLQNWSPWSAPYRGGELAGGTPVLSPGPRRYIQFSIEFLNHEIDATKIVEQLSIDYLLPPIADDLIAEIYPREVEVSEPVQFTYAVRALMDIPGVEGFDSFEVLTPTQVLGIDRIEVADSDRIVVEHDLNVDVVLDSGGTPMVRSADNSIHPLPYSVASTAGDTFAIQAVTDRNFIVRFPRIARPSGGGARLLKIYFRGRVLLYSTLFRGQAILSTQAGSIQRITPGNAGFLGEGDLAAASGITVLSPAITQGSLLGSLTVLPNPFTPNGDGINDVMRIGYDIVAVTRAADVQVRVFDLSGRLVRKLYGGAGLSGHYDQSVLPELAWDGHDTAGQRVPPGIYLVNVSVEGDARESQHLETVAVAY